MSAATAKTERESRAWIVFGLMWIVSYFGARIALDAGLVQWLRVVVVVIPVIPFGLFLLGFIRSIGSADELERRIHLEGLAVAFPLTVFLLMLLGLLQLAIDLSMDDWSYRHIWPIGIIFYFGGLAIARRRYQ